MMLLQRIACKDVMAASCQIGRLMKHGFDLYHGKTGQEGFETLLCLAPIAIAPTQRDPKLVTTGSQRRFIPPAEDKLTQGETNKSLLMQGFVLNSMIIS